MLKLHRGETTMQRTGSLRLLIKICSLQTCIFFTFYVPLMSRNPNACFVAALDRLKCSVFSRSTGCLSSILLNTDS
jgi:hypothetical protein